MIFSSLALKFDWHALFWYLKAPKTTPVKHLFAAILLAFTLSLSAQVCNPDGNIVVITNYDGGILNVNCDVDIPNLKIGIVTYEGCSINITGPFAGNVTQVVYAGFNAQNNNCGLGNQQTSISGVPAGITSILFAPPAGSSDPNGNNSIICAYSCGTNNQGGCNTSTQVATYFQNTMGGVLRAYVTQYACWNNVTLNISDAGCCGAPPPPPALTAEIIAEQTTLCVGQCINFTGNGSGNPTQFDWTFTGALVEESSGPSLENICFTASGQQTVTLTVSNGSSTASASATLNVEQCGIPGCTYPNALNYNANASIDNQSCLFDCEGDNDCPADLNGDGVVNTADLIEFLASFGSVCE